MCLSPPERPTRLGLVGGGFRAQAFLDLAHRLPEWFTVTAVVTRSGAAGAALERRWEMPSYRDPAQLRRTGRPDLVLTAVAASATPALLVQLVALDLPVLAETPPAPDVETLRRLWKAVGGSGLVQVAEQYPSVPSTAALLTLLRRGVIGRPTSVQVSSTHLHHAVALMRAVLGVGDDPARVWATSSSAPGLDPLTRAGWSHTDTERQLVTTLALLDWGEGRTAVYDYTENQMRNPLRARRMLVRGSRGEVVDGQVTRLLAPGTVVESPMVRRQTGQHLDLEAPGLDSVSHDGQVLYRNPFRGTRLSDEEVAMATVLHRGGMWARGQGEAPYPLAQAAQDTLLGLAIVESAAGGRPVTTGREAWAVP